jgi:hypothetical protein
VRIIEQFCDAYEIWDGRSNVGDVYFTPIMEYLGGHARRSNDPHELGEYEIGDVRQELLYLTGEMKMDAAFLVASLIRAVDAELVATSESYGKGLTQSPAGSPRPDQKRIADWRELMAPVIDRANLERAYAEQWGEPG